jgi:hypothetical protein
MRDAYIFHRLRKYRRKQFKRSDPHALKKWRYWMKLYGGHTCLWKMDE